MKRSEKNIRSPRADVAGVLDPSLDYDTDAVMEFVGIGEESLRQLREAGKLTAYKSIGGWIWYRGADIHALIFNEANVAHPRLRRASA